VHFRLSVHLCAGGRDFPAACHRHASMTEPHWPLQATAAAVDPPSPTAAAVEAAARAEAAARDMCTRLYAEELAESGVLPPCRTLPPLAPALTPQEYAMMERDLGKYALYYAALRQCAADMRAAGQTTLHCLALGPGGGRLAAYCLEAGGLVGFPAASVRVCCVEANPEAVEVLRARFTGDDRVTVHQFTLHPCTTEADLPPGLAAQAHTFDVGVAELLGSFGDNEFMTEITSALRRLLLRPGGELIPDRFTVYVAPLSCPATHAFMDSTGRGRGCGYVMGLAGDCTVVADPVPLYSRRAWEKDAVVDATASFAIGRDSSQQNRGPPLCCVPPARRDMPLPPAKLAKVAVVHRAEGGRRVEQRTCPPTTMHGSSVPDHSAAPTSPVEPSEEREMDEAVVIHGFIGYFTSTLYRGLFAIDTRHTSPGFNAYHWEAYYMPLAAPLRIPRVGAAATVTLRVRRVCSTVTGALAAGALAEGAAEAAATAACPSGHMPDGGAALRLWHSWAASLQGVPTLDQLDVWQNAGGLSDCIVLSPQTAHVHSAVTPGAGTCEETRLDSVD